MKKLIYLALCMASCMFVFSCEKKEDEGKKDEPAAKAILGVEVSNAQNLYEIPINQTSVLDVAVVANPTSAEAYTITIGTDESLVAKYNSSKGTSYKMLPLDAYSFLTEQVILTRYGKTSSFGQVRLGGGSVTLDETYVLPIVIESVQGGTNFDAPDDKAAYVLFKAVEASLMGSGKESDPYLIASVDDFLIVGDVLKDNETVYMNLTADLDFSEVEFTPENPWKPINPETEGLAEGEPDPAYTRKVFFDGKNHKISNFTAGAEADVETGETAGGGALFAVLEGRVQNLIIENAEIECAKKNLGGILAGYAGAPESKDELVVKNVKIINSTLTDAYKRAGGLIGYLNGGKVEDVEVECDVFGSDAQNGGMFGRADYATITNCSASGNVESGAAYSGGLIGILVNGTVTGCHATGNVTHTLTSYTRGGGLIGQIDGDATISQCYATGDILGISHMGGGLIGVVGTEGITVDISECYATGSVTLPTSGNFAHAGGLLGTVNAKDAVVNISNCYATGPITVRRYSSGFVGTIFSVACKKLSISNSYTTSDLSGIGLQTLCGMVLGQGISGAEISCSGFVAWNTGNWPFSYGDAVDVTGNYNGNEGTVSQHAKSFNWDESIWDLSKDFPTLKNVK